MKHPLSTLQFLLLVIWVVPQVRSDGCPSGCSCNVEGSGRNAICHGGSISGYLASLPPDITSLSVISASSANILRPGDFVSKASDHLSKLAITKSWVREIQLGAFSGLSNLKMLNLSHNNINNLGQALHPLNSLQHLDISYNSITDLHTGVFRYHSRLVSLILDGNRLQNLHGYVFQGLQNLHKLSLRNCGLKTLAGDLFSIVRSIRTLDLGQNHITELPGSQEFRNLPSLRYLYFDHNEVRMLRDSQFSGITLDTLHLKHNYIDHITDQTFKYFNVRVMDISYNRIENVYNSFLRPTAPQLVHLNMAGNPLGQIKEFAFEGLYRLETLNLSACSLDVLANEQFNNLQNLKKLDISWNNLQSIPSSILSAFDSLEYLDVSKNYWRCDCYIKPFREWLKHGRSSPIMTCFHENSVNEACLTRSCASPSHLVNKKITQLTEAEVEKCQEQNLTNKPLPTNTQAAIVTSCLIFALILIIVTICLWRRGKTKQGLKKVCVPSASEPESSHLDCETKVKPFADYDIRSLNESDRSFVFRNYFQTMPSNPSIFRWTPSYTRNLSTNRDFDSVYSSQPSLYSNGSANVGIESTV